ALLRARLAEVSATKASLTKTTGPRVIWRLAPAGAVFFSVLGVIAVIFGTTVNAEGPKPKAGLTPGETRPITIDEICRNPDAQVISANIPEETRRKVFSEYG